MLFKEPKDIEISKKLPDAFVFEDGRRVNGQKSWKERAEELKGMFAYYMYGPVPTSAGEIVTRSLGEWEEKEQSIAMPDGEQIRVKVKTAKLQITITFKDRKASFEAKVCLPLQEASVNGYPVCLEMGFVWPGRELELSLNAYYAASRGYATICYNPMEVAADRAGREGVFYQIHPYGDTWEKQTGVLAAWGWGASKILDALEYGLAETLHINWENNLLFGVSRLGKATLVAGANDKRIKVVVPACSGAGGAAMYRYRSKGYVYDLKAVGYADEQGNTLYKVGQNEALCNLQSDAEGHWFNDIFLQFECEEQLPVDQHELAALIADENRYLFMISAITEEDWVNAAAMGLTYIKAKEIFDFLGLGSHACLCEHLKGHAVLLRDMKLLLNYCDKIFGRAARVEVQEVAGGLQKSVFWNADGTSTRK